MSMLPPEQAATSPNYEGTAGGHAAAWIGWMALFGALGVVVTIAVNRLVDKWCVRNELELSRSWMSQCMDQLRRGEIDCLASPDPRLIDQLLADKPCAARVRELYIGGDLSDPRLGRLRELPNLSRITFLFARNPNGLLQQLHGMRTLENLTFEHTGLEEKDLAEIGSLPRLKSLSFNYALQTADLRGLRNQPSLERLVIARATFEPGLVSVLKTMPRLRYVAIGFSDGTKLGSAPTDFEGSLRKALPHCDCRVWDDER